MSSSNDYLVVLLFLYIITIARNENTVEGIRREGVFEVVASDVVVVIVVAGIIFWRWRKKRRKK